MKEYIFNVLTQYKIMKNISRNMFISSKEFLLDRPVEEITEPPFNWENICKIVKQLKS